MSDATQKSIEEMLCGKHRFRRERARTLRGVALPRFADIRYVGRLESGRRATVGFAGVGAHTRVRFAVEADEAARFSVVRHGWIEWLGSAFGLSRPWSAAARSEERARLERKNVRDAIDRIFVVERADSLELARGELVAVLPFLEVPAHGYPGVLHELDGIARHFDRIALRVRVLKAVRRALSGEHGPRCAYCHGGLSGEEEDLVACEECATVLHASCWHENARCPVLGCVGEHPERA